MERKTVTSYARSDNQVLRLEDDGHAYYLTFSVRNIQTDEVMIRYEEAETILLGLRIAEHDRRAQFANAHPIEGIEE